MDGPALVRCLERVGNMFGNVQSLSSGRGPRSGVGQRSPATRSHDDHGPEAPTGLSQPRLQSVDSGNVMIVVRGERTRLTLETCAPFRVGHLGAP